MSPHYIYRCYDHDDRLIYVGASRNPVRRLDCHRMTAWWAYQVADVQVMEYPSKQEATSAERHAIATENPRWNSLGKWAQHADWSEQDFRDYLTVFRNRTLPLTAHSLRHLEVVHRIFESRFGHPLSLELANQ